MDNLPVTKRFNYQYRNSDPDSTIRELTTVQTLKRKYADFFVTNRDDKVVDQSRPYVTYENT